MNFQQKYNKACKIYENSLFYKRKFTQIKHLNIAKSLIEECITENSKDYNCWYVLGLIWYWFPQDYKDRNKNCEKSLKRAIEIRPDYNWSIMYLGHLYFDEKKYKKALKLFEKLNHKYFVELDLYWRVIKYQELILCCKFYLNFEEVDFVEIDEYAKTCEISFESKEYECIFPVELVRCLVELSEKQNTSKSKLKAIILRFKEMLDKTDNDDIFTDDFRKIENNLLKT